MNETRVSIEIEHATSNGAGEKIKLIGSDSSIDSKNKEPVYDTLHKYTNDLKIALEDNDEKRISTLFDEVHWVKHLEGFRLRPRTEGSSKLIMVSTPLLDIIQLFPKVAERLFYKMMTVKKWNIEAGSSRASLCNPPKPTLDPKGKSYICFYLRHYFNIGVKNFD